MQALYQDIILDHYRHPRHHGLRDPSDAEAHHVNPTCGDEITLRVHLTGEVIDDVSYVGEGCSISQASASVLGELVIGHTVTEALATAEAFQHMLGSQGSVEPDEDVLGDAVAFAGVAKYPARVKCALLAWMAWKDATARAVAQKENT